MKICKKCGVEKPRSQFYKNESCRDGLFNNCKECERIRRQFRRKKSGRNFMKYTPEEDEILRNEYPHVHSQVIADKLGRTFQSVCKRASYLGIGKSPEYMKGAMERFVDGSVGQRFKKGHVPWIAGKKMGTRGRSGETQFKKGSKPHNYLPVGSIRKTHEGYWQKKMTDTGYPPRDWVPVSHLIWEELHGPLPDGYVIKYLDENPDNLKPENLQAMSRADSTRLQVKKIHPEIKKINQLLAAISRQVNKRERNGE